jgi:sec-independent protein translocase protein TatC
MPAKKKVRSQKKISKPNLLPEVNTSNLNLEIQEYNPREKVMTLGEHLEELRVVLLKCIATLGILMLITLYFGREIHSILVQPYKNILGKDATFFQIKLMAPILIYLKTSFMISLLISIPIQLYFIWGFISPAVDEKMEQYGKYLIFFSSLLFWSGVAVCWFLVFESFLNVFLVMFHPPDVEMKLPIDEYYDIFFNIHLIFGIAFQLPIVLILLSMLGILSSSFLLNRWREAILILSIFSAVLSPGPDVFSMLMLFAPLLILFFLSIFFMRLMEKKESSN